jgi:RND family efflux transporter MFP subunit
MRLPGMTQNRRGILLSAAGVLGLALLGCQRPSAAPETAASSDLPRVNSGFPAWKSIAQQVELPAQFEPFATAPIQAKVAAYVKSVLVDIGDRVQGPRIDGQGRLEQPGQPLVILEANELIEDVGHKQAKVAQAEADCKQAAAAIRVAEAAEQAAQAAIEEALAARNRADADYRRWKSEFARIAELAANKTVTQKLADESEQQFRAAQAAVDETMARVQSAKSKAGEARVGIEKAKADAESVQARLGLAGAELRGARVMADYLTLRAPFTGIVASRNTDPGRLVQPGTGAADSTLLTIVQADVLRLFVEVPEADAPLVAPGRKAAIRVAALPDRKISGLVTRTSWSLGSSNRTLRAEIDVPNSDGTLRPGMFAQVELIVAAKDRALVLPKTAVVTRDGQPTCLVIGPGGKLEARSVVTGLKGATEIEIATGLTEKDEVLLANVAAFKPGQSVAGSTAR